MTGSVSASSNATVSATVTNTGGYAGVEVVQLYAAGLPGDPLRALKGFGRVNLTAGASAPVAFTLTAADMSSWDVAAHAWKTFPAGEYAVWVASSSRDLRLQGTVSVAAAR